MEHFGKDVQVGTFIVVLGAVVLPIVGPTVQQDQDILELLKAPLSLVWTSFLFIGVCLSGICCFGCVNTKQWGVKSLPVYITLVVARVFSSVLSTSLSKALALVSGLPLITVIAGFLICGFVLGTSVVLQATKTEQKLFVPIISCATQMVNAVTGLILWEDWRVVQSWAGYAAMIVQIIVGVYLISSLDFFENTAEPNYGLRQTIALQSGSVRTMRSAEGGGGGLSQLGGSQRSKGRGKGKVTPDTESANHDDDDDGGMNTDQEIEERRKIWEELKKKIDEEGEFVFGVDRAPMSSIASVGSVRGLIGGISREPSYQFYRRPTMEVLTEAFDQKYSAKEKMMMKSLELAEAAAKNGEDNFVYEIDSAVMDSIGSLTDYDDINTRHSQRKT